VSPQSPRKLPRSCTVAFGQLSAQIIYAGEQVPPQEPVDHRSQKPRKVRKYGDQASQPSIDRDSVGEAGSSQRPSNQEKSGQSPPEPSAARGHVSPGDYRSYFGQAVLVLVLYWVFYLPGLIANFVYLHDARRYKERTGDDADGIGCLWALLWFFFLGPICVGIILGIMIVVGALQL
jgi:hypothetical protein